MFLVATFCHPYAYVGFKRSDGGSVESKRWFLQKNPKKLI